jgi:hypothetical protein
MSDNLGFFKFLLRGLNDFSNFFGFIKVKALFMVPES